MKNLDFVPLETADKLVFPEEFCELHLDSPALSFITDFKDHHPAILTPSVPALEASRLMRAGHLGAVLVLDRQGEFVGLLSDDDISYQRVMQRVAAGQLRQELTVGDLMRPRRELQLLSYPQVESCTIREVLQAMRREGQPCCLVVDRDLHHVRGLVSAMDVARRLHADIHIEAQPTVAGMLRSVSATS
ncbi:MULTISPECIES: CBS domain-containing protein [Microbulbifer]|uniref:CBS domain-containing protein n=1 Tax=Microbulbifer TaxID=48073 RepID=UPI001E4E7C3E|nr:MULTISPECIES: CBS domain-containing protein [Microbulbifer]UHQ56972.1 CBS domain-containing protein [Microbulbifer sp. YPW16]